MTDRNGCSGHGRARVARCSIADLGKYESKAGTPRGGPRAAREPYSGIDVGFMPFLTLDYENAW